MQHGPRQHLARDPDDSRLPALYSSVALHRYQAATLRFYFDNPHGLRSSWGDPTYQAGQAWNSIGGWFEAYPWLNPGQASYINSVQGRLTSRTWEQPGF